MKRTTKSIKKLSPDIVWAKLKHLLDMAYFYEINNTSKNINNPFYPPQTITQGNGVESMKTTEEMFQFIFTYMPYKLGDEKMDLERKE